MMRITILGLIIAGLLGMGAIAGFDWDAGCSSGPDGCPTWPAPTPDAGCSGDPNGGCLPGS